MKDLSFDETMDFLEENSQDKPDHPVDIIADKLRQEYNDLCKINNHFHDEKLIALLIKAMKKSLEFKIHPKYSKRVWLDSFIIGCDYSLLSLTKKYSDMPYYAAILTIQGNKKQFIPILVLKTLIEIFENLLAGKGLPRVNSKTKKAIKKELFRVVDNSDGYYTRTYFEEPYLPDDISWAN